MSPDWWSVVWEAVAAVGTIGAVGWAVYTTLAERRKRTRAEQELTAEKAASRTAKRREQADHVAVWFDRNDVQVFPGSAQTFENSFVVVGNYSSAPIFNVSVSGEALVSGKSFTFEHANVIPPAPEPWTAPLRDAADYFGELLVCVRFQDVAGVVWQRWSNGDLEEMARERPQT